ncbi:MAG: hypothetical protein IPH18_10965 [Chitinophagaceae bacterium]|nr:hypothetical protein [Chitinophagaceae bacterium]
MDPEDYAEIRGLWEALERNKISFYNFGEANETTHVREEWYDTLPGAAHAVMVPCKKHCGVVLHTTMQDIIQNIPDQFRMEQFESEFTKMWMDRKMKCRG